MRKPDRQAFRLAYAAWLVGIFAYFIPAASWNPVSRFSLTRALVEHRSLRIDPYADHSGDRARVGERWYSDKAPVVAFLAAPAYAFVRAGHLVRGTHADARSYRSAQTVAIRIVPNRPFQQALYVSSLATSGIAGVAVALLLFELLRRRTTTTAAFLASSLIVLGSPILPYATSLYGHVVAAAFLLCAVFCLDQRGQLGAATLPSRLRLRLAGAALALAPGAEYLTAFPAAIIGAWFLVRVPKPQRFQAFVELALGAIVPVALIGLYQTSVFGSPWSTGYSFQDREEFALGHAQGLLGIRLPTLAGLYGLTFGQRRGLFYIWPLLVVALLFSVQHALRRRDWAIGAGLAALGVLFFLNAGYYMWWGGAAFGPRHLIPGIAFLGAGLALGLRSERPWLRAAVLVLGAYGVLTSLAGTAVGFEAPEYGDLLKDYVWPRLEKGKLASTAGATNLGSKLGLPPNLSLLPLALWLVAGYGYLWHLLRRARAAQRWAS